ncbi:MAG: hypothetical protein ABIE84_01315 [bacterium]
MFPAEAQRKEIEILKTKTGEERLTTAFYLNDLVKRMMQDGIRSQFPNASPEEFKKQIAKRLAGE